MLKKFLFPIFLSLSLSSCIGGGCGDLSFEEADYPISMTEGTFLKDKTIAQKNDYVDVGDLELDVTSWAMIYGLASISGTQELGPEINEQIKAVGGHAVRSLKIELKNGAMSMVPIMTLIPFWPNNVNLTITGTIIRYKNI